MFPITFTLPHLISSITPSSSSHFTPCLPYQPREILQSFVPTPSAHPSHKQCLHVPCLGCGHLSIVGVGLTHHYTSCITHMKSLVFGMSMPLALPSFPPFSTWTWIASLYIIDVFYLSLPCPLIHTIISHMLFVSRFNMFCASL